ncbi:hypothetical protein EJ04DRAFT_540871 [Polyplosphaeria fusca]|uniref:Zn(2)-C6 fungal-type domain-containing protein n=1 Tax=Polyplosphaeria fusca TaxID=682080 RepID=A0A9P4V7E6_9PLEO|nr:hypothetical protein EJ04DRAFT_540871 [Polyplosphaeria fusca]
MELPPRRRRRPALSCVRCRQRKTRCDRTQPCAHCVASKVQCTYTVYSNEPPAPGSSDSTTSPSTHRPSPPPQARVEHNASARIHTFDPNVSTSSSASDALGGLHVPADPTLQDLLSRLQSLEAASTACTSAAPESARAEGILVPVLTLQDSRIILNKTRTLRWSHWMGAALEFAPIVNCFSQAISCNGEVTHSNGEVSVLHSQIRKLLGDCKNLARRIKMTQPGRSLSYPEPGITDPPKKTADAMTGLYFESFDIIYRLFHVPTFWTEYHEYWAHPEAAPISSRLKILLVVSIGSSVSPLVDADIAFRKQVFEWVHAAHAWLSNPLEKDILSIEGLQIYCLTILARQIFSIGGDFVWISAGSLIHTAMQIGLHRDPKHLPPMSLLQAEIRRRTWATILELAAQASLDSAMPPRISFDEFDTAPPSNVNDDDLDKSNATIRVLPKEKRTDTSFQLLLLDSLPTRLRILRLLNGLNTEISYTDVLALDAELTNADRACSNFMNQNSRPAISTFHRNSFRFLTRRFLIPLHHGFAQKARSSPLFYYSLKSCLDASIAIISPEPDEGFSRLMTIASGMFKEGILIACTAISLEVVSQAEVQRLEGPIHRNAQYTDLKRILNDIMSLSLERMRKGETNTKLYMFLSMLFAQIEATEAGTSCDLIVAQAAKDSLQLSHDLLKTQFCDLSLQSPSAVSPYFGANEEVGGFGFDIDMDFFFQTSSFS